MRFYQIESPIVIEVTGQDASRYMNARLTNDFKTLPVARGAYGAALTPQGKAQALFTVCRLDEQRYLLTCDGGNREIVYAAYRKYMVADRVNAIDVSDQYRLYHLMLDEQHEVFKNFFEASLPSKEEFVVVVTPKGVLCSKNRGFGVGIDVAIALSHESEFRALLDSLSAYPISRSDMTLARIMNRLPSFPEEINEDSIFSESRFYAAISFKKGCYVGQEVVERIDAIGKTPKTLQLVEIDGCQPLTEGCEVSTQLEGLDKKNIGKILTSAWNPQSNKTLCFATLKNDSALDNKRVSIGSLDGTIHWRE